MSERPPITQKKAVRCMIRNLFLPGVGSLGGGRRSGWGQFLLLVAALTCFAPLAFEAVTKLFKVYQGFSNLTNSSGGNIPSTEGSTRDSMKSLLQQHGSLAMIGVWIWLAAWIWAFFTSVSLLTEGARGETQSNNTTKEHDRKTELDYILSADKINHDKENEE